MLPVSARTDGSRRRMQEALESFCRAGAPLRDVSHTLAHGRAQYPARAAAVAAADRSLSWIEPSDAPSVLDASDDVDLVVGSAFGDDPTPAGAALREAVERELDGFDVDVRERLRPALEGSRSGSVGVRRVAQFVLRAAVLRVAGPGALRARPGSDRLLRIAAAAVRGELKPDQIVMRLRDGVVAAGPPTTPTGAVSLVSGALDSELVRGLLVSQWVHGADVDRRLFCAEGRRVPLPGYAFERRRFTSDIRLDHLLLEPDPARDGTTRSRPPRRSWPPCPSRRRPRRPRPRRPTRQRRRTLSASPGPRCSGPSRPPTRTSWPRGATRSPPFVSAPCWPAEPAPLSRWPTCSPGRAIRT